MKRDMELIRKILLAVESHEHGYLTVPLEVDGYDEETLGYHCYLLMESGFVEASDRTQRGANSPKAKIHRLTWEGHEFIAAAKNPSNWEKAKETLTGAGQDLGGVTIGVLQGLLARIAAASMGL